MRDIFVERKTVNLDALDAELRGIFGAALSGVSFAHGLVTVHLHADADADSEQVRRIVLNHDPDALTPAQQKARDQAARLEALRKEQTADLDPSRFADPLLAELARKLAWLEQEVLSLRDTP